MKPTINSEQLEISIATSAIKRRRFVKPCRPARAHWWFDQMRRVVEQAAEWPPHTPLPPEQIGLPLTRGR
jgi:hypothetical protein